MHAARTGAMRRRRAGQLIVVVLVVQIVVNGRRPSIAGGRRRRRPPHINWSYLQCSVNRSPPKDGRQAKQHRQFALGADGASRIGRIAHVVSAVEHLELVNFQPRPVIVRLDAVSGIGLDRRAIFEPAAESSDAGECCLLGGARRTRSEWAAGCRRRCT